jgi:outer membrane immunogenic protein
MKMAVIAAAALATLTGTAFAADLPVRMPMKAEPPPPVVNWTACYVGAGGGYGMWNQKHTSFDPAGIPFAPGIQSTTGGEGWFGTAQVGCDYQFDHNWLVGAFVDGNWGSLRGDFVDNALGLWGREKEKWSWAAGGRVGYLLYPQLLTFLSGGYTEAHFEQIDLVDATGAFTNIYPKHTYGGYFIGTGYEYKLAWLPGFTWKTEYRYSDYGSDRLPLLTAAGVATGSTMSSHKYEQTVRSELVWRFWSQ